MVQETECTEYFGHLFFRKSLYLLFMHLSIFNDILFLSNDFILVSEKVFFTHSEPNWLSEDNIVGQPGLGKAYQDTCIPKENGGQRKVRPALFFDGW